MMKGGRKEEGEIGGVRDDGERRREEGERGRGRNERREGRRSVVSTAS